MKETAQKAVQAGFAVTVAAVVHHGNSACAVAEMYQYVVDASSMVIVTTVVQCVSVAEAELDAVVQMQHQICTSAEQMAVYTPTNIASVMHIQ